MFERLQKPFLTVETGEAYQPIRLTYELFQKENLVESLNQLKCLEKNPNANTWNWYWKEECDDIHFESLSSYNKNASNPLRLGTISLSHDKIYLSLPSFKRACLAAPFFHRLINISMAKIERADFINKVFGIDERLPHGFTELFKDEELERIVQERILGFEKAQTQVEQAATAEEAFKILYDYTKTEASKRLPFAERYAFHDEQMELNDPDIIFLGFYIFLRGRELVAIRRWFGETNITLNDVMDETIHQVFGNMDIDIIE